MIRSTFALVSAALLVLTLAACGGDAAVTDDAGSPPADAGGGMSDAGARDAGGRADAGSDAGGMADAGSDAGTDAGPPDAGSDGGGSCGPDLPERGRVCDPAAAMPCTPPYVCEGFGATPRYECSLQCDGTCGCPAGTTCEMFKDAAGMHHVCS